MKRLKLIVMGLAVAGSVCAAFATRPSQQQGCQFEEQYYKYGDGYYYAGYIGYNYVCFNASGICTYYKPNPITEPYTYAPCRLGYFVPFYPPNP